mmetsp:Transcript_13406/g.49795  ORF Transcript_13406/g.49795 Transcript_13406/m.49795 type:complete len:498 (+) Transcript_13406:2576-4069(+)
MLEDLGQAHAHSLALAIVVRVQAGAQEGQNVWQDRVPELPDQLAQRAAGNQASVEAHAGQRTHYVLDELARDLAQRSAQVRNDGLPHQDRKLANARLDVVAQHVQQGQHAVPLSAAQDVENGSIGGIGTCVDPGRLLPLVRCCLGSPDRAGPANLAEQVPQQLHGGFSHAPVVIQHAGLERRQQQRRELGPVRSNQHLASLSGHVANAVTLVREALEDDRESFSDATRELRSQARREEAKQPQNAFADLLRGVPRIGNHLVQHAIAPAGSKHKQCLGEPLRGSRAHGVGLATFRGLQQPVDQVGERLLSQASDHRAHRPCSHSSHVRHRVVQNGLQPSDEQVEVWQHRLRPRKDLHEIARDRGGVPLLLVPSRLQAPHKQWNAEGQRRVIDRVLELDRKKRHQRRSRKLRGIAEGLEEHVGDVADLGILHDVAHVLQSPGTSVAHPLVSVAHRGRQRRNDVGKEARQLLRTAVRHGAQHADSGLLHPPRWLAQGLQR